MNKLNQLEVELSQEEADEVRQLLESGDEAAVKALVDKLAADAALKAKAQELRLRMLRDVVLCVHHWMHEDEHDKVQAVLCIAVALIENQPVSLSQINDLFLALNEGNARRARESCEGNA